MPPELKSAARSAWFNYNYLYTGLGDRVQQTVNGVTTTYVLDLNSGLTQVLSDGTDTYLYGLSRIGEEDTAWGYFLGDALGSVRQLTDGSGNVSLAQTFEPYGEVWASIGTGSSSYSFTGEVHDPSGLIFLRARYLDPGVGRFITRDTWGGLYEDPPSMNRWMYVQGNPVMYTDPTGRDPIPWPDDDGINIINVPYWSTYHISGENLEDEWRNLIKDYNRAEKVSPPLSWFPPSDPLAYGSSGIPLGQNAAQFVEGNTYLCGLVAIAAIVDAMAMANNRLPRGIEYIMDLWDNWSGSFNIQNNQGTTGSNLSNFINSPIWSAVSNAGFSAEIGEWTKHDVLLNSYVLDIEAWRDPYGADKIGNFIKSSLFRRHYIIALVGIVSGSKWVDYGGLLGSISIGKESPILHWVVITGISNEFNPAYPFSPNNWFRIYNPFDNQTEYYHYPHFMQAWNTSGSKGKYVLFCEGEC